MGAMTIRNIDDDVKQKLRLRAADHGCSMEEEVRRILKSALERGEREKPLGTRIHELFRDSDGLDSLVSKRRDFPRETDMG